jgi:hypothetical protein
VIEDIHARHRGAPAPGPSVRMLRRWFNEGRRLGHVLTGAAAAVRAVGARVAGGAGNRAAPAPPPAAAPPPAPPGARRARGSAPGSAAPVVPIRPWRRRAPPRRPAGAASGPGPWRRWR